MILTLHSCGRNYGMQGERNFNRFGGWLGKNSTAGKNTRLLEDLHVHVLASRESSSGRLFPHLQLALLVISFTIYHLALFIFHPSVKTQTCLTSCLSSCQCYVSYSNVLTTVNIDHRETLRVDYLPLLLNRLTSPLQTLPKVWLINLCFFVH